MSKNTREIALDMIIDIMENDKFSHIVVRTGLKNIEDKQERSFVTKLTMGTVEKAIKLDYIIESYSKIKIKKMKPVIRNLLRMSVYQIYYMDSVPDSAVCNEAVKIIKKRKFSGLSGFVNGVLRNVSRNKEFLEFPGADTARGISITYSCPLWICEKLICTYGIDNIRKILEEQQDTAYTTVRVNRSKTNVVDVINSLTCQGIKVTKGRYCDAGLILKDIDNVENIKAFEQGLIQPQDESSMLVGMVASPQKGDYVVDVCSAPGGKSLHMADLLMGSGHVDSRDVSEYKVNLIKENIDRSGFENISAKVQDACVCDKEIIEKADIVIADVPCSGLGVINKKADIKYKLTEEGMHELTKLQRDILDTVSKYVKPGGVLIYSTCTLNPWENIDNIRWFTDNYQFSLESIEEFLPDNLKKDTAKDGYIQLVQGIDECDGFFIARLRHE